MARVALALTCCLVALAGCGDDEPGKSSESAKPTETAREPTATKPSKPPKATGTVVTLRDSEFGSMLFDSRKQAIYIFEKDPKGGTVCYGECAEAWPPVYTDGDPKAGAGVKQALLGKIKRRDGRQQVTYAGKPLYFYDHEGPGEVRCHNVNLNGGLWWVVGPDGKRRA